MAFVYLILFVVAIFAFYKTINAGSYVNYFIYRYSGTLTILIFLAFYFQLDTVMSSGAKRLPLHLVLLGSITYFIWFTKAGVLIVKRKRKGFLWGVLRLFAYLATMIFPFSMLANKMYREYEVGDK